MSACPRAHARQVTYYMSWIPLIFGSAGSFGGGFISDRLSRDRGVTGRLLVLIGCCVSLRLICFFSSSMLDLSDNYINSTHPTIMIDAYR